MIKISEEIKRLRASKNWTQGMLAAKTGIDQPRISKYEQGRELPEHETLKKIAHAFDLDVQHFYSLEKPAKQYEDQLLNEVITMWAYFTEDQKPSIYFFKRPPALPLYGAPGLRPRIFSQIHSKMMM